MTWLRPNWSCIEGPKDQYRQPVELTSYLTSFVDSMLPCANETTKCIPNVFTRLISLPFSQNITKLLQWTPNELRLLPQVGSQEAICVADSDESGLESVLESLCRSRRCSVNIINTGKLEQTLDSWGCDETSTTRGGDKLDPVSDEAIYQRW
jgi:hypothetical protein